VSTDTQLLLRIAGFLRIIKDTGALNQRFHKEALDLGDKIADVLTTSRDEG